MEIFQILGKHNSHCFAVRSVLLPCMLFCRKICSFEIYAVLLQNLFCRDLRTFYVEKNWARNFVRGEKMTNIMYASTSPTTSTSRPIQPSRMALKTSSSCSLFPKSSSQGHGQLWKGFFKEILSLPTTRIFSLECWGMRMRKCGGRLFSISGKEKNWTLEFTKHRNASKHVSFFTS